MESLLVFLWAFRGQVLAGSIIFFVTQVAIHILRRTQKPRYKAVK